MLLQARRLNVQNDMQPVCQFFKNQGLSEQEVVEVCRSAKHVLLVSAFTVAIPSESCILQVVSEHPPVLSYSIDNRLQPFMAYLQEIGIAEPAKAVLQRPTLLGLDADKNLRAIVGYLQENGHSPEDICHLLQTSI